MSWRRKGGGWEVPVIKTMVDSEAIMNTKNFDYRMCCSCNFS